MASTTARDPSPPLEVHPDRLLPAYAVLIRGHVSVSQAVADDTCRQWSQQWWSAASPRLDQPETELAAYREALLERFANPRMQHQLAQIGSDGSQKLPIRILPVQRAECAQSELDPIPGEDAEVVDVMRQQYEQFVHQARA